MNLHKQTDMHNVGLHVHGYANKCNWLIFYVLKLNPNGSNDASGWAMSDEQWMGEFAQMSKKKYFENISMPHEGILLLYSNAMWMENLWHGIEYFTTHV